jgi:hypothetical protein
MNFLLMTEQEAGLRCFKGSGLVGAFAEDAELPVPSANAMRCTPH